MAGMSVIGYLFREAWRPRTEIGRYIKHRLLFGEEPPPERMGRRRIPKMAYSYAVRIAEITGLPVETVLKSRPMQNYIKRLTEWIEL